MDHGFSRDINGKLFSRAYINNSSIEKKTQPEKWQGRYFIETDFGYWTSSLCYSDNSHSFTAPNKKHREQTLEDIRSGDLQDDWLCNYESELNKLINQIQPRNLHEYIDLDGNGKPDKCYLNNAMAKLHIDKEKSSDHEFATRFAAGYSFVNLPQLGEDHEEFAVSLCKTLLLKMKGRKVHNQLARVLKKLLGDTMPDSAVDLLNKIREDWRDKPRFRQALSDFHKHIKSLDECDGDCQ